MQTFSVHLDQDPSLAEQIGACQTPEAIIHLAHKLGYTITSKTLRAESSNLAASHWPWSGKGTAWRRQFFDPASAS